MDGPIEPATIRVMVFNIEEGGAGVDLAKVVEAIRRAEPDIVALQEAVGNADRIAASLGWGFASHRTQVISPHPIVDPPDPEAPYQLVEVRPGRVVAVMSVHPPAEPYGPEAMLRGASVAEIIELERRIRLPRLERPLASSRALLEVGIPVFLAGDFNAPSHLDWTSATVGLRRHVRAAVPWPVSGAVEAAGFRDAWREVHPDPLAEPGLTWWAERPPTGGYEPGPDTPDDRIDMVYVAGPARVLDSRIIGEAGRADVAISVDPWPSDHRAVVVTVEVVPLPMAQPPGSRVAAAQPGRRDAIGPVRLETSRPTYRVGEPIEVRWAGGPGFRWDWIAVFAAPVTDPRDAHLIWRHTGARAEGAVRLDGEAAIVDQSSVGGRWPLAPGAYEAAYLLDDGPDRLARVAFVIEP